MAISHAAVNTVPASGLRATFDVTATADADTTHAIAHGLGVDPDLVILEPLSSNAGLSLWFVPSHDATNVNITKGTGAGSGNASAQLRVHVIKLHSIQE